MKKHISKYITLLFLALTFAAPGIAAYFFFQHPSLLGAASTNKGTLLTPPVPVAALNQNHMWRIVYWHPENCQKECLEEMDVLARMRLALGRRLYEVELWLVSQEKNAQHRDALNNMLKNEDAHLSLRPLVQKPNELFAEPKVFLVNPDNYLILSYLPGVNPEDIYRDLKLLLNNNPTKSS